MYNLDLFTLILKFKQHSKIYNYQSNQHLIIHGENTLLLFSHTPRNTLMTFATDPFSMNIWISVVRSPVRRRIVVFETNKRVGKLIFIVTWHFVIQNIFWTNCTHDKWHAIGFLLKIRKGERGDQMENICLDLWLIKVWCLYFNLYMV